MRTRQDEPILFHNTMTITEGHLDGFKHAIRKAVEFVSEHGPQLMVEVFIDEENMLAHSFQLYRDSEAVLAHWRMSDPYIRDVMEHCSVRQFDVYGQPNDEVRAGLRPPTGDTMPVSLTPPFTGFTRLAG
ncbi:hypothetical protein [Qaidamihabitans albus]|uniref:hypothetical protein n=1 Tax=Qaidamihabitans albus TaxID=2795733 RepID=UPI0018F16970|nr:hypothetical protein [Qaidamihabitans albus]